MPERIQRKRTKGYRLPEGAVIVDRTSKWGNPFKVGERIDRDSELWPYVADMIPGGVGGLSAVKLTTVQQVVDAYAAWFVEQPALMLTAWDELAGRDLACFCKAGAPCHADYLIALVNDGDEEESGG
jgi:hypothetical protein